MRNYVFAALLGSSLLGAPMLVGCDRTVSEKKVETKNPDGSSSVDKSKTTDDNNGDTKTETKHESKNP